MASSYCGRSYGISKHKLGFVSYLRDVNWPLDYCAYAYNFKNVV